MAVAAGTVCLAATAAPYAHPRAMALLAALNIVLLAVSLVIAVRGQWRGAALWPLLLVLAGPALALGLPWNAWQAQRAFDAHAADYTRIAAAAAHGDLGETTHAGPRWVRLPADAAHLAAGGEVHVRRDADGAWIWFPHYITPWFGGGGGLQWEIHDRAPGGQWRYHVR